MVSFGYGLGRIISPETVTNQSIFRQPVTANTLVAMTGKGSENQTDDSRINSKCCCCNQHPAASDPSGIHQERAKTAGGANLKPVERLQFEWPLEPKSGKMTRHSNFACPRHSSANCHHQLFRSRPAGAAGQIKSCEHLAQIRQHGSVSAARHSADQH